MVAAHAWGVRLVLAKMSATFCLLLRICDTQGTEGELDTIVCVGGSSTAGGGPGVGANQSYPIGLERRLAAAPVPLPQRVEVLNMAHGTTNTMYAVMNFDSLIPFNRRVPLVVWEYAINDSHDHIVDQPWSLMMLLRQMARHPSKPLIVIVLLWDSPFHLPEPTLPSRYPKQSVYSQIKDLVTQATAIGLVAGVVDMAAWVIADCQTRIATGTDKPRKKDYVADGHHMNAKLHAVAAEKLEAIVVRAQECK